MSQLIGTENVIEMPTNPQTAPPVFSPCDRIIFGPNLRSHPVPDINEKLKQNALKLITINTNSFYNNMEYMNNLIERYDVVFVQETMVLNNEDYSKYLTQKSGFSKYYIESTKSEKKGRSSGGMACFVKNGIPHLYSEVAKNIMLIKIKGSAFINVYLPHEGKSDYLFKKSLEIVKKTLIKMNEKNMESYILGDFNVDLSRKSSKYTKYVNSFLLKNNMIPFNYCYDQSTKITFFKGNKRSYVDHVIANTNNENIVNVQILVENDEKSSPRNKSDHHGISLETFIKIDSVINNTSSKDYRPDLRPKYRWNMLLFREKFNVYLNNIIKDKREQIISLLQDINEKTQLQANINHLYEELHLILKTSADKAAEDLSKLIETKRVKVEPWWTNELIFLNKESKRLHTLFKCTNKIHYQIEADITQSRFRKLHREQYQKYKHRELVNLDRMKNLSLNNFWKKLRNKLQKKTKVQIDIDQLKETFYKTFNEKLITDNNEEEQKILDEFKNKIKNSTNNKDMISEAEIIDIIKELGTNKSIGRLEVSNEMFKYATNNSIVTIIANIINKIMKYGVVPLNMNTSIIKPLIKDTKKSHDDTNNIRPISVSDTFCTIFEKYILRLVSRQHINNLKQFGFKVNSSCQHAIFTLNEIIRSAKRNGKRVFVCAIDASKAFDKVNRVKLWLKLINMIDHSIVKILMNYYNDSQAFVQNELDISAMFATTVGVKQGGSLSPRLFAMYIEDVIKEIELLNAGIKMGKIKIDIILYADDMLNVLTAFGQKNEIKFNGSKTSLMIFNKSSEILTTQDKIQENRIDLKLSGELIKLEKKMKYLGVWLTQNLSSVTHIDNRYSQAIAKLTQLEQVGFNTSSIKPHTKSILFKSFIRPVINYGSDVLLLTSNDLKTIKSLEGNIIKDCIGLFRRIKSTELFLALKIMPSLVTIEKNKLSLFIRLCDNEMTKKILHELMDESNHKMISDSLINDIIDILNHYAQTRTSTTLNEIRNACNSTLNTIIKNHKFEMDNNELSIIVREELLKEVVMTEKIEFLLKCYEGKEGSDTSEYSSDTSD